MRSLSDKTSLEALYYIRQAGEIALFDLLCKMSLSVGYGIDSTWVRFKYNLEDLYNANFIAFSIRKDSVRSSFESNNNPDNIDVHLFLNSISRGWHSMVANDIHEENDYNNVLISVTEYFDAVQTTIGFSLTDEIHHMRMKLKQQSIFGRVQKNLKSKAFVIMPFSEKFVPIYKDHIERVCKKIECPCLRVDLIGTSNVIVNDI